jgi:tetratricopeptide (TPR) repeat protein
MTAMAKLPGIFMRWTRVSVTLALAALSLAGAGCAVIWFGPPANAGPETAASAPPTADIMSAYLEGRLALDGKQPARTLERLAPYVEMDDCPEAVHATLAEAHLALLQKDQAEKTLRLGLERYPQSAPLALLLADVLRQQGKREEAIAQLDLLLTFAPHHEQALETLSQLHLERLRSVTSQEDLDKEVGNLIAVYEKLRDNRAGYDRMAPLLVLNSLYLRVNRPQEAIDAAQEALKLDRREVRVWLALGNAWQAKGDKAQAAAAWGEAVTIDPSSDEIRAQVESALRQDGGPEAVSAFYVKLAGDHPDSLDMQSLAAQMLVDAEDWAQAEPLLERVVQRWPGDAFCRLSLTRAWLALGKLDKAEAEARKMAAEGSELAPHVVVAVGEALLDKGEMPRLIDLLADYRQRDPGNLLAAILMIQAYADLDRYDEAHGLIDNLPEPLRKEHGDDLLYLHAGLWQRQSRNDQALQALEELIGRDATKARYFTDAGAIYQEQGKLDRAEKYFRQAVTLAPQDAEACNTLGYFYAETGQRLDEAVTLIRKALELKPDAGHIVDSLGWTYYKQEKFDEAVKELERAARMLEAAPDAVIYEHLGDAYDKQGRKELAREAWRKALELNGPAARLNGKIGAAQ